MTKLEPDFNSTDYYKILGVKSSATKKDITKAYRVLALKWHPDKNPKKQAMSEEIFKKISMAYQVLGNDKERSNYDNFGSDSRNWNRSHSNDDFFRDPFEVFKNFFGNDDPFGMFAGRNRHGRSAFGNFFGDSFQESLFDDVFHSGNGNVYSSYQSSSSTYWKNGEKIEEKVVIENGKKTKMIYKNDRLIEKKVSDPNRMIEEGRN